MSDEFSLGHSCRMIRAKSEKDNVFQVNIHVVANMNVGRDSKLL